jgi:HAD superfamily hydrolase (TIGR01509 family)
VKPRAVIFDLGKVLLHFDWTRAAQGLAPRSRVPAPDMLKVLDYSHAVIEYELGRLSSREFFLHAREAIGFDGTFEDFAPLFSDIFNEMPAMIALHAELRRCRVPTFILSNTCELAVQHIRANYPFFAGFTGYVFSFEHGSMKPEAKMYEVAEELSGCRGPELLYIDDLPKNLEAGRARGWQVVLQEQPEKTVAAVRQTGVLD